MALIVLQGHLEVTIGLPEMSHLSIDIKYILDNWLLFILNLNGILIKVYLVDYTCLSILKTKLEVNKSFLFSLIIFQLTSKYCQIPLSNS